ncbi:Chromosome partition protein smc [Methanosarcina barkeri str. Wiesmoor]|uniref:Chromosome partition protein smc n=2 Tax=Methanosarcina barkeri TaxID=2208 RepID=A0A0E3QKU9_METBA|nr:hypothetical protein [Methanosarcina barkeri]AKB50443.1 Chromosome partition protein smc [Methanosarcina barkeri str. Wiesmoor]
MRNLFINKLEYSILCADNSNYGALIEFKKGLNIIYGPNSVGKSSIITGILYGLGAEKSLGIFKNKDNPFKPEFYDKIEGKKIIESHLLLEINNSDTTVTIKRNIKGKKDICTVKDCNLEQFHSVSDSKNYILGNGTMDEYGFQRFLFNFLKWEIVEVLGYDGDTKKLYFENLVPLFFIEQKAGWSQIQARQITRYNIRDVKKISFEYLFGLEKFDIHLLELQKKEISTTIKNLKAELDFIKNHILAQGNATVDDGKLIVDKIGFGRYEINNLISCLEDLLKEKEEKIRVIYDNKDAFDSSANSKRDKLRQIINSKTLILEKKRDLIREINSYKNYIAKIEINKKKNKQLEQIEKINFDLNITRCPVCESKLNFSDELHCKLCKSEINNSSTATENLLFLEDEKASFVKILETRELELEKTLQTLQNLNSDEEHLKNMLDFQMKTYLGQEIQNLRDLAREIDKIYSEILNYKSLLAKWNNLIPLQNKIDNNEDYKMQIEQKIKEYEKSVTDTEILETIKNFFILNSKDLHLFTANDSLTHEIQLYSSDNYTPSLEIYDISNISSSSDYIRIILSYYLALLQASIKLSYVDRIRYPNLLILDEPKQQNLDDNDIRAFVKIITKIPNIDEWQIILTTFNPNEKDLLAKYIKYEMINKKDFLLKKI